MKNKFFSIYRIIIIALCAAMLIPSVAGASAGGLPFDAGNNIVLLVDPETGAILYANRENEKAPIASMTKIMTLLLIFEHIDEGKIAPGDMVTISKNAADTEGSQAFLDNGSLYSVSDLIRTIIISSANDSAVAMAEFIAGSEQDFVSLMNMRAAELLMTNTVFKTCTGLPASGQFSTAMDVSIMARELMRHTAYNAFFTTWMDTLAHPSGRITELTNTNRLVRFYQGATGLKTGYSGEAKHCIAACADRGNMRLLTVLIGFDTSKARFDIAQKLLDYGFNSFEKTVVVRAGDVVKKDVPVRGAAVKSIDLIAQNDVCVLTRKGAQESFTVDENLPDVILAPATNKEPVGGITVTLPDGSTLYSPVVIAADELESGFFSLMSKILSLW